MSPGKTVTLRDYRSKRDPGQTPEPFGSGAAGTGQLFVVQKHAARRLHYDLRLEMDGVLKSWAVPKGPSVHAHERRLAVQVEDHPLEYADFEGVIPKGNYGAGNVIVWDRGWYRLAGPLSPSEQIEQGKLEVEFFGARMRGRWTLVRLKQKEKDWLLLKKADAYAGSEELTERYPTSVLSGLTVEEIHNTEARIAALRARLAAHCPVPRAVHPTAQSFMLATLAEKPFSGRDWLFEIKYDGVRVFAYRERERIELYGRSKERVTERYPEVTRALSALPFTRFLLDGEVIALDESGRPSFQRLQQRMHATNAQEIRFRSTSVPVTGVFFDCLSLEGYDLRSLALETRKEFLQRMLPEHGIIQFTPWFLEHGEALFEAASEQRLEGIVAKRIKSLYAGRRSTDWIKVKCQRRQEFVIGGYTAPRGGRAFFGALHLGVYEGSQLVYVSKVGSGFSAEILAQVWQKLEPLGQPASPFHAKSPAGRGHYWVAPSLVCEVRFSDWTRDGGLRHPIFMGLRTDKRPEECQREIGAPLGPDAVSASPKVIITNPKKVFWPDEGYTKEDMIAYYESVAPFLLPYLRDRPLVLTRYPDGIKGKSFFQKDAPEFVPAWVQTERIYSKDADREIDYFIVNDTETLKYVANLAAIPLHIWSCRIGSLERPDWLILDLDPKGAPFTDVVEVARATHKILKDLEVASYVKTSGATGLHILIPTGGNYSHQEAKDFSRLLASFVAESIPQIATIARPLRTRAGKVYIDWGQNGFGKTIVAPFSLRPLPFAPVSFPLRWQEVTKKLEPRRFTLKTAPARLRKFVDPGARILTDSLDMAGTLKKLAQRLLLV